MAQWFEDFSGNTTGQPPAGWTSRWATGATLTVEEHPGAMGSRVARLERVSGGETAFSFDASGVLDSNDYPIRVRGRFLLTDPPFQFETRYVIGLHASGGAGDISAYRLGRRGGNVSQWRTVDGGTPSLIASAAFELPEDVWAYYLMEVDGSGVRSKVWLDTDSEPGAWTLSSGDTQLSSGWVALTTFHVGVNYHDWIGVGTRGDDAPTRPPPPVVSVDADLTLDASVTAATVLPGADISADLVLDAQAAAHVIYPQATLSADLVLDTAATAHSPAQGFAWVAPPENAEVEDTVQLVTQSMDPRVAAIRYRIGDTIIGIAEPE